MSSKPPHSVLGSKALTAELIRLASEVVGTTGQTRFQILADLIWKWAIGWTEVKGDKTITYPPVEWAAKYVFERIEGKAATAEAEVGERITAADKVADLARQRINKMANVAAGPPKRTKK